MRARERQRLEWRREAASLVGRVERYDHGRCPTCDRLLARALSIILVHGPVPLRPQAKKLLGRLG